MENGGRNMIHKETVTTPVTETKYIASDGRVFKNEDEAELHEKLLYAEKKVKKWVLKISITLISAKRQKNMQQLSKCWRIEKYIGAGRPERICLDIIIKENLPVKIGISSCMRRKWTIQIHTMWKR